MLRNIFHGYFRSLGRYVQQYAFPLALPNITGETSWTLVARTVVPYLRIRSVAAFCVSFSDLSWSLDFFHKLLSLFSWLQYSNILHGWTHSRVLLDSVWSPFIHLLLFHLWLFPSLSRMLWGFAQAT